MRGRTEKTPGAVYGDLSPRGRWCGSLGKEAPAPAETGPERGRLVRSRHV